MTTHTTQPRRVGALVAHHPGRVITPVRKETHGTLGPTRGWPEQRPSGRSDTL